MLCYLENVIQISCLFYKSSVHYKSTGVLYVPQTSVEEYKSSHWGKDFAEVIAIEDSEYANWDL